MIFFILVVLVTIGIAVYVTKKTYFSNKVIPTTPPSTIHDEIAKTIAELKTQDPVIIEAPFVSQKAEELKSSKTTTKSKNTKAAPKMSAKKTTTKKTTKK